MAEYDYDTIEEGGGATFVSCWSRVPRHSRVKKSGEWFKDVTISLLGRSFNSAVDALVVRCGGRGFWKRRSLRRERGDLLVVFLLIQ